MTLSDSDSDHLGAAEGWLALGSFLDANEELEEIEAAVRGHPDVLNVRWQIYDELRKREEAQMIIEAMIVRSPDRRAQTSYALACLSARLGKIDEATAFLMESLTDASPAAKLRALNDKRLESVWSYSTGYQGLVEESTKGNPSGLPQTPYRDA